MVRFLNFLKELTNGQHSNTSNEGPGRPSEHEQCQGRDRAPRRFLFALIFLMAGPGHFSSQTIGYAASQGVPLAFIAVPVSGAIALAGALSILLGYRAKIGAWLLVLFLVPVTFKMHAFWSIGDAAAQQIQMIMFMKNLGLLGGAPADLAVRRRAMWATSTHTSRRAT